MRTTRRRFGGVDGVDGVDSAGVDPSPGMTTAWRRIVHGVYCGTTDRRRDGKTPTTRIVPVTSPPCAILG